MSNVRNVYFFQKKPNGLIKIGCTKNPIKRLIGLRSQTGEDFKILFILFNSGFEEEKKIHEKFKNIKTYGEWFKPDKMLLDFIKKLKAKNPNYNNETKRMASILKRKNTLKPNNYNAGITLMLTPKQKNGVKFLSKLMGMNMTSYLRHLIEIEISNYDWI